MTPEMREDKRFTVEVEHTGATIETSGRFYSPLDAQETALSLVPDDHDVQRVKIHNDTDDELVYEVAHQ